MPRTAFRARATATDGARGSARACACARRARRSRRRASARHRRAGARRAPRARDRGGPARGARPPPAPGARRRPPAGRDRDLDRPAPDHAAEVRGRARRIVDGVDEQAARRRCSRDVAIDFRRRGGDHPARAREVRGAELGLDHRDVLPDLGQHARRDDRDACSGREQAVELAGCDLASADDDHGQPVELQERRVQRVGHFGAFAAWMPHSVLPAPRQRPARSASPGTIADVHGAQPIDG